MEDLIRTGKREQREPADSIGALETTWTGSGKKNQQGGFEGKAYASKLSLTNEPLPLLGCMKRKEIGDTKKFGVERKRRV